MVQTLNSNSFYIMAVQYTKVKWSYKPTDKPGFFELHSDQQNQTCELATVRPSDPMMGCDDRAKANAALIVDAVNNTAGKGIDPNAVPEIMQALRIVSYALRKSDKLSTEIIRMVTKAIKAAAIK